MGRRRKDDDGTWDYVTRACVKAEKAAEESP